MLQRTLQRELALVVRLYGHERGQKASRHNKIREFCRDELRHRLWQVVRGH